MLLSGFGAWCAIESSRNHFACMHVLVDALSPDHAPNEIHNGTEFYIPRPCLKKNYF